MAWSVAAVGNETASSRAISGIGPTMTNPVVPMVKVAMARASKAIAVGAPVRPHRPRMLVGRAVIQDGADWMVGLRIDA